MEARCLSQSADVIGVPGVPVGGSGANVFGLCLECLTLCAECVDCFPLEPGGFPGGDGDHVWLIFLFHALVV